MQYEKIPPVLLRDFRRDMARVPWPAFLAWPQRERDQIITLMAQDFEHLMDQEEHLALREAYLSTEDDESRKRMLYEHYQRLLKKRGLDQ
ncbi:hypothetical protein [Effusibacillus pohliae]|uniref:hypothetical protein n=1 Tax=Effusibacillus pohliae TaxID=232270 RepID=UPI000362B6B5|nr:hypothetical protein [Effusibacillus pohliae]